MHHQAQEKAQAELDRVVGTSRLPDFADREDLVYVRALTSEVMRWQLIAPLGTLISLYLQLGIQIQIHLHRFTPETHGK